MKKVVELKVNGELHEVAVSPQRTLLEVLREDLHLTGTKEGCGLGACGTCTVLLDGKPILSCLTLAREAKGKEVITIEGLASEGKLHPLQQAFIDHGAIQCGYCTSGMIISAVALFNKTQGTLEANEVKEAIGGNHCRCTGYKKIIESILSANEMSKGIVWTLD